jgi:diguanylate cyclase (GGDEF)-like protein
VNVKEKLLIVEDSRPVLNLICHVGKRAGYDIDTAMSLAETKALLDKNTQYAIASIDYNLPDAPSGEALDLVLSHGIPSIVMTGSMADPIREAILARPVVDYIPKETTQALKYLEKLLVRLRLNRDIKVLLVDDSKSTRAYVAKLLSRQNYQILEAGDGKQGIAQLVKHPDIKLIITDHEMPNMGGIQFIAEVRRKYNKDEIAIIGLSGSDSGSLSARFIKNGANDFLKKPFYQEEFYCRTLQNIEHLEYVEAIQRSANTDYLTSLFNRRYFLMQVPDKVKQLEAQSRPCAIAMIDIDHFKRVNDSYGHDAGDLVIKDLADKLIEHFSDGIVSRFGGEEFSLFLPDYDPTQAKSELDEFRQSVADSCVKFENEEIEYTVSIGLTSHIDHINAMLAKADEALYQAKENGRDQVQGQ